jgi:general secretion pathway protein A
MYLGEGHTEALAALELGVLDRRGLIVVVGEVGTGKTTLAKYVLKNANSSVSTAFVSTTTLSFEEILFSALRSFGLQDLPQSKAALLDILEDFLTKQDEAGEITALLVDEAQNLSDEVLEEFRLLLNIETTKNKLLQIVLLGQPELHDQLQKPSVRHISARIAVRANLNPLPPEESQAYIAHRLKLAGGEMEIFSPAALKTLIAHAKGIPREINVNCHNALLFGFGAGLAKIDKETVIHAIDSRLGEGLRTVDIQKRRRRLAQRIALSIAGALLLGVLTGRLLIPSRPDEAADFGPAIGETTEMVQVADPTPEPTAATQQTAAPTPEPATALAGNLPLTIIREPNGDYVIRVERGITLSELMLGIYGSYEPELLEKVIEVNPQIRDPNILRIGQIVRLPKRD